MSFLQNSVEYYYYCKLPGISIKIRIIILFSFTSDKDILPPVVPEDKVMFGVHAHAISLMTVAKIRKVYNKVDAKTIAKQV